MSNNGVEESESRRGSLQWDTGSCDSNERSCFGSKAVNRRACRFNNIHSTTQHNSIQYSSPFGFLPATIPCQSLFCNVNQQITRTISGSCRIGLSECSVYTWAVVCCYFTSYLCSQHQGDMGS